MKQRSIRQKLFAFVVVLVSIPILAGAYLVYRHQSTLHDYDSVRKVSARNLALVNAVRSKFQTQNLAWSNFLLRGHVKESYNLYLSKVYQAERETYGLAKRLSESLTQDQGSSENILEFLSKLERMRSHYRDALVIYNQSEEPHFATDRFLAPYIAEIEGELAELVDQIERRETDRLDALTGSAQEEGALVALVALVLVLLFVVVFLYLIDVYVARPLASAIDTAERISTGQTDTRVQEGSSREFSVFARAFNNMMDTLSASQKKLEFAIEEAERSSAAKSMFLSQISHELRTPMHAVLGFAQLLELSDLGEDHKAQVREITSAGNHLMGLIDELLDLSRIESGTFELSIEPVEVADVVDQSLALVRSSAKERNIRIGCNRDGAPGLRAMADFGRSKEVVLNLLSNAIKYTHADSEIRVGCQQEGDNVLISVCDDGPGIAEQYQSQLFEPFNRLGAQKTDIEGTGIGLAISKRLARAMGGDLVCESEPNKETCFYFSLPAVSSVAVEAEGIPAS